ncbi:MAG TPA: hypothetical protein VFU36_12855 [Jatrophihabitans sp.]|nr:hypothetical protein [Jatrophihabitans sp.]
MDRVPPWWVVARPARRSRSDNDMVMTSWQGTGVIGQLAGGEQSAACFLERVVPALRQAAVVRARARRRDDEWRAG